MTARAGQLCRTRWLLAAGLSVGVAVALAGVVAFRVGAFDAQSAPVVVNLSDVWVIVFRGGEASAAREVPPHSGVRLGEGRGPLVLMERPLTVSTPRIAVAHPEAAAVVWFEGVQQDAQAAQAPPAALDVRQCFSALDAGGGAWPRRTISFALEASRQGARVTACASLVDGRWRLVDEHGLDLVLISPGTFQMGVGSREAPHVPVTISDPFWLAAVETPQSVMPLLGPAQQESGTPLLPIRNLTWDAANGLCEAMSVSAGAVYRLPTEAEWEYACRAGTTGTFSHPAPVSGAYMWYNENAMGVVRETAMKKPNPWGLHDMHGNVREWCSDWYGAGLAGGVNPRGPDGGAEKVRRGGMATGMKEWCGSGVRDAGAPGFAYDDLGFRVVREADQALLEQLWVVEAVRSQRSEE